VRLYKLRDHNSFLSTPYTSFGAPETEKQAMGADLLEAREIILSPGQTLDLKEKMAGEAAYLGVVALFRSPAPRRWRFAFSAANTKITMGVHACAMTVTDIAPVGMSLDETAFLSSIKCRQTNNDQPTI
jgi:type VI secretion system protein VasD